MRRLAISLVVTAIAASCTGSANPAAPDPGDGVEVVRVLDGDSVVVGINGKDVEVRLLGINTPERDECYHGEAKARTTQLVGDRVALEGDETDRFGRLLRYAYTVDGVLANRLLVAEGFALALTTDHAFLAEFKEDEAAAWNSRSGLWQPDACGPPTGQQVSIRRLEEDAPGADSDNRNGEFVDIGNDRETRADLGGWVLRDESSSHRFVFPADFTLDGGDLVRVFSGCGQPNRSEQYFCDGEAVWNNGGDTAILLDPSGNVVDRLGF